MADLIDRDAVLHDISTECSNAHEAKYYEAQVALTRAKRIIRDAPAVNRWIPRSERLPEIDEDVIVYSSFWKDNPIQIAHLQQNNYFWESRDGEYNLPAYAVTHWMPLPEPPKEDET